MASGGGEGLAVRETGARRALGGLRCTWEQHGDGLGVLNAEANAGMESVWLSKRALQGAQVRGVKRYKAQGSKARTAVFKRGKCPGGDRHIRAAMWLVQRCAAPGMRWAERAGSKGIGSKHDTAPKRRRVTLGAQRCVGYIRLGGGLRKGVVGSQRGAVVVQGRRGLGMPRRAPHTLWSETAGEAMAPGQPP